MEESRMTKEPNQKAANQNLDLAEKAVFCGDWATTKKICDELREENLTPRREELLRDLRRRLRISVPDLWAGAVVFFTGLLFLCYFGFLAPK